MRLFAVLLLLGATAAAATELTPKETLAVYAAAGMTVKGTVITGCAGDAPDARGSRFEITRADLNVDGRQEAIVSEINDSCFGTSGRGFVVLGTDPGGRWHRLGGGTGSATVLRTRHLGWANIAAKTPDGTTELHWTGLAYK